MKVNDKLLHFSISAVLTVLLSLLIGFEVATLIVIAIGVGKELWDRYIRDKVFSVPDLIADGSGIVIGLVIFSLIKVVM